MSPASQRQLAPLAVTMGDPAGIGPEITALAWQARAARGLHPFVVFADPALLEIRARDVGVPLTAVLVDHPSAAFGIFPDALPVIPVPLSMRSVAGQPAAANATAVTTSIEHAAAAVVRGEASALVTNPIAKSVLYEAGFKHPGHTEFLGALAEARVPGKHYHPVMMLASRELRVVPLTIHIPLADVPSAVTRKLLFETVRTTWRALRDDFGLPHPRIAVTGLNPHAGESGTIGHEEREIIGPAIDELRAEGLSISGPHSADTLFHAAARLTYDAAICMYHDQALIPIKTLSFDTGVNVTLGLPFVRTSPDHGTAFDIAGQGRASPESLIASLEIAAEIAARRLAVGVPS